MVPDPSRVTGIPGTSDSTLSTPYETPGTRTAFTAMVWSLPGFVVSNRTQVWYPSFSTTTVCRGDPVVYTQTVTGAAPWSTPSKYTVPSGGSVEIMKYPTDPPALTLTAWTGMRNRTARRSSPVAREKDVVWFINIRSIRGSWRSWGI